jgi:two-component system, OmpR family, response regulator
LPVLGNIIEIARTMDRICNILVVEDDDSVRALLGDVLDHAGYEFTLARDGAEMRAALDAELFNVAIIDISLRGGEDGFALGEAARGKGCSVILMTGDPERRVHLEASGRRHLMKPFRMKQLTDLIDEILRDDAALCVRRPPPAASALSVPK